MRLAEGIDIVAGWVDTHGFKDTGDLLEGLPSVSPPDERGQDGSIMETDLPAVLERHPEIVLVDDLACQSSRTLSRRRRFEDVGILLDAGISIYGTLNVTDLESAADEVARITGSRIAGTVPDSLVENADVIQLVDASADTLIGRLREGKIYLPLPLGESVKTYFQPESINALRELALRSAFKRVELKLLQYRLLDYIEGAEPAGEGTLSRTRSGSLGGGLTNKLPLISSKRDPSTRAYRWWRPANGATIADYLVIVALLVVITLLGKVTGRFFSTTDIAMLYLLPVVYAGARAGMRVSIATSVVGILCFDVLFVPPMYTITVADIHYLTTFAVFLLVAVTTSVMANNLRRQVRETNLAMSRIRILYSLSKELAAISDIDSFAGTVADQVSELVGSDAVVYLPGPDSELELVAASDPTIPRALDTDERAAAIWAFKHGQEAGADADTLPGTKYFYLPLKVGGSVLGVLSLRTEEKEEGYSLMKKDLLVAIASLVALALDKLLLALATQHVRNMEESERLRNALFDSISHDLRTPLSSIIGAVTSLTSGEELYTVEQRAALLQTIDRGAARMNRLVQNLLDMARLESGGFQLNEDWCDVQDIIGVAIAELSEESEARRINIVVHPALPLIKADFELLVRVLSNLIDNAIKYSPDGSQVEMSARNDDEAVAIRISDQGPGVTGEDKGKVFEKFYRLHTTRRVSGTGLGLTICKGIVDVHGGSIWVEDRPGGGSVFVVSLPVELLRPQDLLDESEEI